MGEFNLVAAVRAGLVSLVLLLALAVRGECDSVRAPGYSGLPNSFADLAQKVKPAVVKVSTTSTIAVPGNPFHQFSGQGRKGKGREGKGREGKGRGE